MKLFEQLYIWFESRREMLRFFVIQCPSLQCAVDVEDRAGTGAVRARVEAAIFTNLDSVIPCPCGRAVIPFSRFHIGVSCIGIA